MKSKRYGVSDASDSKYDARRIPSERIRRFPERLKQAIGSRSILSFSKDAGLSEGVIHSYLRGATYPSLDRLDKLADAAKVDVQWLGFGDEGIHTEPSVTPPRAAYVDFDMETLQDALEAVEMGLEQAGNPPQTPEQKAKLVLAAYEFIVSELAGDTSSQKKLLNFIRRTA